MTDHGSIGPLYDVKAWRARREKLQNAERQPAEAAELQSNQLIVRMANHLISRLLVSYHAPRVVELMREVSSLVHLWANGVRNLLNLHGGMPEAPGYRSCCTWP